MFRIIYLDFVPCIRYSVYYHGSIFFIYSIKLKHFKKNGENKMKITLC